MELKFRIQEFKKLNSHPTFNPQVKQGFFGKWKNIVMYEETDFRSSEFAIYQSVCREHNTWDLAMAVINKYKDFFYKENAGKTIGIINRKVC